MKSSASPASRLPVRGFTLLELLCVIGVLCILLALLLPAVRVAREPARRMQCANNLKQLGLALDNYHAAFSHYPSAMGGTGVGASPLTGNANRLSGIVSLLPYLEQTPLWNEISQPATIEGVQCPAMGPAPWITNYSPWQAWVPVLRCASANRETPGQTNYAFCIGDVAEQIHTPPLARGAFACGLVTRLEEITDGASHTIALGEIGTQPPRSVIGGLATGQASDILTQPRLCLATLRSYDKQSYESGVTLATPGRGGRWADGSAGFSLVNTILPPNSPSCAIGSGEATDGIYSVSSMHVNGAHVLLCDGAYRFIASDIDTGDASASPPTPKQLSSGHVRSPFGIWGAMGTASGNEPVP